MLNIGDVVRLFFPHQENKNEGECRLGIIVEDLQDKFLIVPLSCQVHQKHHYPNSFIIHQKSPDGKLMNLSCDSLVMPNRASQISKKFIRDTSYVGSCSEEMLDKITLLC